MEYSTPLRGSEEKEVEETGFKQEQSQYRQPENENQEGQNLARELDHYEEKIRRSEERLRDIAIQKRKHNQESEEYANLDDERRTLRKEIVDLDYQHNRIFQKYKKNRVQAERRQREEQSRKLQEEIKQIQRARQEQRLERSRRLQKQLQEINQSNKKRREEIEKLYQRPPQTSNQQSKPQEESVQQEGGQAEGKEKTQEEKLAEANYKARVAEIELQLASQKLRRSRQVELQAELIKIRSYSPYYWWRSYGYPYHYSLYPYSYRLSPFYDSILYPRYYPYGYPLI